MRAPEMIDRLAGLLNHPDPQQRAYGLSLAMALEPGLVLDTLLAGVRISGGRVVVEPDRARLPHRSGAPGFSTVVGLLGRAAPEQCRAIRVLNLDLCGEPLDLTLLAAFTGLRELRLSNAGALTGLATLTTMTHLQSLRLEDCQPLEPQVPTALPAVQTLMMLQSGGVVPFTLPTIQALTLEVDKLTVGVITPIPAAAPLRSVVMLRIRLPDLRFLSATRGLSTLALRGCALGSLVGIPETNTVKVLELYPAPSSLDGVAALQALKSLHITDSTPVVLSGAEALAQLPRLRSLLLYKVGLPALSAPLRLPALRELTAHTGSGQPLLSADRPLVMPVLQALVYRNWAPQPTVCLDALRHSPGLTRLELSGVRVADFSPLQGATALKSVTLEQVSAAGLEGLPAQSPWVQRCRTLSFDGLDALRGIQAFQRLTGLALNQKTVPDALDALAALPALRLLSLRGTDLRAMKPLPALPGLLTLSLMATTMDDLRGFAGCTGLKTLEASVIQAGSLAGLPPMAGRRFVLSGSVDSLEGIEALSEVRELVFFGHPNRVERVGGLSALGALSQLRRIEFHSIELLEGLSGLAACARLEGVALIDCVGPLSHADLIGAPALRAVLAAGTRMSRAGAPRPLPWVTSTRRADELASLLKRTRRRRS